MLRTFAVLLLVASSFACGEKKQEAPAETAAPTEPAKDQAKDEAKAPAAPDHYTVKGVFKGYDEATKQIAIHHEAIPTFKNREGEESGMMSMQMSFRVGDGVDPSTLAADDKIEFEFDVEWDQSPAIKVTKVTKLPPETELAL